LAPSNEAGAPIIFLTRRKVSFSAEISLSFLAYNLKRVINILGTEEILRRLRQRGNVVLV
jgi:hypothetical protein